MAKRPAIISIIVATFIIIFLLFPSCGNVALKCFILRSLGFQIQVCLLQFQPHPDELSGLTSSFYLNVQKGLN